MFTLTKAQANAIQELNWVDLADHDEESVALYHAVGSRKLTATDLTLLDMDFIVERAEDELEMCLDYGEPRDRIGYVSRVRSLRKLTTKMARYLATVERMGDKDLTNLEVTK